MDISSTFTINKVDLGESIDYKDMQLYLDESAHETQRFQDEKYERKSLQSELKSKTVVIPCSAKEVPSDMFTGLPFAYLEPFPRKGAKAHYGQKPFQNRLKRIFFKGIKKGWYTLVIVNPHTLCKGQPDYATAMVSAWELADEINGIYASEIDKTNDEEGGKCYITTLVVGLDTSTGYLTFNPNKSQGIAVANYIGNEEGLRRVVSAAFLDRPEVSQNIIDALLVVLMANLKNAKRLHQSIPNFPSRSKNIMEFGNVHHGKTQHDSKYSPSDDHEECLDDFSELYAIAGKPTFVVIRNGYFPNTVDERHNKAETISHVNSLAVMAKKRIERDYPNMIDKVFFLKCVMAWNTWKLEIEPEVVTVYNTWLLEHTPVIDQPMLLKARSW